MGGGTEKDDGDGGEFGVEAGGVEVEGGGKEEGDDDGGETGEVDKNGVVEGVKVVRG